jgi:hypothetical protein
MQPLTPLSCLGHCSRCVIIATPIQVVIHKVPCVKHVTHPCVVPPVSITDWVSAVPILPTVVAAKHQSRVVQLTQVQVWLLQGSPFFIRCPAR